MSVLAAGVRPANWAPPPRGHNAVFTSLSVRREAYKNRPIQYSVLASVTASNASLRAVQAGIGTSIILTLESEKYKSKSSLFDNEFIDGKERPWLCRGKKSAFSLLHVKQKKKVAPV